MPVQQDNPTYFSEASGRMVETTDAQAAHLRVWRTEFVLPLFRSTAYLGAWASLVDSGMTEDEAREALCGTVTDVIENGWEE